MSAQYFRGEVLEIDFNPAKGSEPDKIRPGVVIQNDVGNKYSSVIIVAAITGAENVRKRYPVDVPVPQGEGGLAKDSVVQCNLIRCVDKTRVHRSMGRLNPTTMQAVDGALRISLSL